MRGRVRLIFMHVIESLSLSVLAAVFALILQHFFPKFFDGMTELLAKLGVVGIGCVIIFLFILVEIIFPCRLVVVLRSMKRLPTHFGIITKVIMGAVIYTFLTSTFSHNASIFLINSSSLLVILYCAGGLFLAWLMYHLRPSKPKEQEERSNWFANDAAISSEKENLLPQHLRLAERILRKLTSEVDPTSLLLSSIALVGPYGSGKTSICNLIKDVYKRKSLERKDIPHLIFCHFEAWQFLSPEAAVKGLITTITDRILSEVDVPELWKIPNKYINAIKASGDFWSSVAEVLPSADDEPKNIVGTISDTLLRLDIRVVVFVDDFDRIEGDAFASQQAVAKALNQLQQLPNIQYIISVGPMLYAKNESNASKPTKDLLKLTRFQELIPTIEPEVVLSETRKLRDNVLKESKFYFPWSEITQHESDPLAYNPLFEHLVFSFGFVGKFLKLVNTPRVLKYVLRESDAAWKGGLRGEFDWYNLILTNAIKAAEPAVFEWVERERNIFIDESPLPLPQIRNSDDKERRKYAEQLKQTLIECIQSNDPNRYERVKETLCYLFPVFHGKIECSSGISHVLLEQWSQRIACRPSYGMDYIERFFMVEIAEKEKDQPTLQYIKKILSEGFNSSEFESRYLSSYEKLTGPFNKIVQFSGLIPKETAYSICDCILAWIAIPEHAKIWPESSKYIYDILADIFAVIKESGMAQRTISEDRFKKNERLAGERSVWLQSVIERYTKEAPLLASAFLEYARKEGFQGTDTELPKIFIAIFCREFIEGNHQFLPALKDSKYSLSWLIHRLREYDEYQNFKTKLTQKLISEGDADETHQLQEQIIISLVNIQYPVGGGEIPIESYVFSVNQQENIQNYDMSIVISALTKWQTVKLSDKVAERAFLHLVKAYGLDKEKVD